MHKKVDMLENILFIIIIYIIMHVENEKAMELSAFTCIRQPKDTAWSAVNSVLRFLT